MKDPDDAGRKNLGRPYQIKGVWYTPHEDPGYDATGLASWYGGRFHGRPTASGEIYDMTALTAAHTTLPLGTRVQVTNLENGRAARLRINDRGPFVKGRIIDVSRRAAQVLGFRNKGLARVRVQITGRAAHSPGDRPTKRARPDGDRRYFADALNAALEHGTKGSRFVWRNKENGHHGIISPLTTPVKHKSPICRNYRRTLLSGGRESRFKGRACREDNGHWRILREQTAENRPAIQAHYKVPASTQF